jgi:hypothetical protein
MSLFFDIETLETETKCDPVYLVQALQHWFNKNQIPKNITQSYKPLRKSLAGTSFLLNPKDFFKDKTTDIIWRAQYIRLAARRDYTLYKIYGFKFLDLSFMPDLQLAAIKNNTLLNITDNKIYFKYEE